jgi:hypothetical protein
MVLTLLPNFKVSNISREYHFIKKRRNQKNMSLQKFVIKHNRHIAIDVSEIIGLDFNESMKEIKIHLRGGGIITVEGKKAAKVWKQLSQDVPDLLQEDNEELSAEVSA